MLPRKYYQISNYKIYTHSYTQTLKGYQKDCMEKHIYIPTHSISFQWSVPGILASFKGLLKEKEESYYIWDNNFYTEIIENYFSYTLESLEFTMISRFVQARENTFQEVLKKSLFRILESSSFGANHA